LHLILTRSSLSNTLKIPAHVVLISWQINNPGKLLRRPQMKGTATPGWTTAPHLDATGVNQDSSRKSLSMLIPGMASRGQTGDIPER
jgi:hypothetical protein